MTRRSRSLAPLLCGLVCGLTLLSACGDVSADARLRARDGQVDVSPRLGVALGQGLSLGYRP
ncbi:hypothetical protein EKE94_15145 [Mesobaculum littorinae]|uniref:Uncharacterized protein n=1 Tax=Mesobaculum littorinae TaxID=2486419 RepID=A0A438AE75_9RHOB|nr:hypothetical protein [Mesobaculum littorinae]RVV97001.1 hypothetical protein EKE94_15145 [Mesobaculum littorinae]